MSASKQSRGTCKRAASSPVRGPRAAQHAAPCWGQGGGSGAQGAAAVHRTMPRGRRSAARLGHAPLHAGRVGEDASRHPANGVVVIEEDAALAGLVAHVVRACRCGRQGDAVGAPSSARGLQKHGANHRSLGAPHVRLPRRHRVSRADFEQDRARAREAAGKRATGRGSAGRSVFEPWARPQRGALFPLLSALPSSHANQPGPDPARWGRQLRTCRPAQIQVPRHVLHAASFAADVLASEGPAGSGGLVHLHRRLLGRL